MLRREIKRFFSDLSKFLASIYYWENRITDSDDGKIIEFKLEDNGIRFASKEILAYLKW